MTRLIRACFELLLRLLVKANYKLKTVHLLMTCILALCVASITGLSAHRPPQTTALHIQSAYFKNIFIFKCEFQIVPLCKQT